MTQSLIASFLRRYSLDQHRPMMIVFEMALFGIGSLFWIQANLQDDAFNERTFGRFALMFPAEMWAGLMMAGAVCTIVGLIKPIRRDMVAIGAGLQAAQYIGQAYSSIATGGEFVIGLHLIMLFVPIHLWMLWEALRRDGL